MANTSSTIRIIFDGAVQGLRRAAAQADRIVGQIEQRLERMNAVSSRVERGAASIVRGFAGLGAVSSSIQGAVAVVATLATVTAQLAPAALAVPGVVLGIATAYGVAKLALSGFTDAVKGDAAALAKFSAEGRATVQAVQSLEGRFVKLRSAVQQSFFKGLAPEVKATGAELLDLGKDKLPAVASGFNAMFREGLRAARTPVFKGQLGKIFDDTARSVGYMENTLANVLKGVVGLGSVGSRHLGVLAGGIDDVAARFAAWVDRGINDGSIDRMIERALAGFRDLGRIFVNLRDGARSFWDAFERGLGGAGSSLQTIRDTTRALADFLASASAQSAIQSLGETVRVVGDAFRTVLLVALRELAPILVEIAPFIQEVARQIGEFLVAAIRIAAPILRDFARFLSENKEIIAPLVPLILALAVGFKGLSLALRGFRALQTLVNGLRDIGRAVRNINPATLRTIARAVGRFILPVAAAVGLYELTKALDDFNLAAAGGDPAKLSEFGKELHDFRLILDDLAKGDFSSAWKKVVDDFNADVARLGKGDAPMGSFITDFLIKFSTDSALFKVQADGFVADVRGIPDRIKEGGAKLDTWFHDTFIAPIVDGFERFKADLDYRVAEIRTRITEFFANPAGEGFDVGAAVGQLIIDFLNGFSTFAEQTRVKLGETKDAIVTWVTVTVPEAFANFGTTLSTKASEAWESFKTTSKTKIDEAVTNVTELPGRIGEALANLPQTVIDKAVEAWNSFFTETQTGTDNSVKETGKLPNEIGNSLTSLPGLLLEKARAAFQRWLDGQVEKVKLIVEDAKNLPKKVVDAIGNLGSTLLESGKSLIQGFIDGIESKIPGIRAAAERAAAAARSFFPFSPAQEGPFSGRGWTLYSGQALAGDFARGIRASTPLVAAATAALAASAAGPLSIQSAFDASGRTSAAARNGQAASLASVAAALSTTRNEQPAQVRVFIGETELTDMIRTEQDQATRSTSRRVRAGAGATF